MERAPVVGALVNRRPESVALAPESDPLLNDPLAPGPPAGQLPAPARVNPNNARKIRRRSTLLKRWLHFRWQLRHGFRSAFPAAIRRLPGFFTLRPSWRYWMLCGVSITVGLLAWQSTYSPVATPGEASAAYPVDSLETRLRDPALTDPEYDSLLYELSSRRLEAYHPEAEVAIPPQRANPDLPDGGTIGMDSDIYFYQLTASADTIVLFNCLRLPPPEEVTFLLFYQQTTTFSRALELAQALHRRGGLAVSISRAECLRLPDPGYVIFLDEPAAEEAEVNFRFRRYARDYQLDLRILTL